jgi:hypothetical protein
VDVQLDHFTSSATFFQTAWWHDEAATPFVELRRFIELR